MTSSPEDFLKRQEDSWVQIMWMTTGKKDFARIREISWKMSRFCWTPWDSKDVRPAEDTNESVGDKPENSPSEQKEEVLW